MAENVVIKIDVRADTATIERLRAQLRSLCREAEDCNDTFSRQSDTLRDLSREHKNTARDSNNLGKAMRGGNKEARNSRKSFADFRRELFDVGGTAKALLGGLTGLIKFGFKYLAIEAAAAAVTLASATLLFKTGAFFAKTYQASLSAVAYGFAAAAAAAATFIAAQKQFQSVQYGPMYAGGAANTSDQYTAASGAMKMFVDDAKLAVLGSDALVSAFGTLSKQAPVTGQTLSVFKQLSNVTTGIGGDIGKNTQALAEFIAGFQKGGLGGSQTQKAIDALGPEFKKITDEANKMGLTTYEKFSAAAMRGELGETFGKYEGQLNTLNSTLIGQFKSAFTGIKSILNEIGDPLLAPVTEALRRVTRVIEVLFLRTRANIESFGATDLLDHLVSGFEKIANFIAKILTHNLMNAGSIFGDIADGFRAIGNFFEKLQDFFRPLKAAGEVIIDMVSVIGGAIFGNFKNTLQDFGVSLVENKDSIMNFAESIGGFIQSFGNLGKSLRQAFIQALPVISAIADTLSKVVNALASIINVFNKGGALGSTLGLLAMFMGFRAAKIGGSYLNKGINNKIKGSMGIGGAGGMGGMSSTQVMNVNASAVYLNGPVMTGGTPPTGPVPAGGNPAGGAARGGRFGNFFRNNPAMAASLLAFGGQVIAGTTNGRGAALDIGGNVAGAALQAGGFAKLAGASTAQAGSAANLFGSYFLGKGLSSSIFESDTAMSKVGGTALGIGGGAALGAGIGATIGSVAIPIPGVGTATGALAGAIIGGIAGGIGGYFGAGKKQKETNKAAKKIVEGYGEAVTSAIAGGDIQGLIDAQTQAQVQLKEMVDTNKFGAEAVAKQRKELEKYDRQISNYTKNAEKFSSLYGIGTDEMNKILSDLGIDGTKSIRSVYDVLVKGGVDTAAILKTKFNEISGGIIDATLSIFDKPLSKIEAQKQVDAKQQAILSGATDEESIIEYLRAQYLYSLDTEGGDAAAALANFGKTITLGAERGQFGESGTAVLEAARNLGLLSPDGGGATPQMMELIKPQLQAYAATVADALGRNPESVLKFLEGRISKNGLGEAKELENILNLFAGGQGGRENAKTVLRRSLVEGGFIPPAVTQTTTGGVSVGNVEVNVSGFISDARAAAQIAAQIAAEIRKQVESSGGSAPTGLGLRLR